MPLLLLTLFLFFPAGGVVEAQNVTTAGTISGDVVWSGGTVGTATTGTILVSSGWSINEHNGLESRKDDGRGPTLVQIKKAHYPIAESKLAPVQYAKLAREIGLEGPAEEAEVIAALHDANVGTYPYAVVDDYLYRQALKQGDHYRWVWKPLREKDLKPTSESGLTYRVTPEVGYIDPVRYRRNIPVRVLSEIKTLTDCLPKAVFLVSDYEVVHPDPFLAVSTPELLLAGKIWIIDQWDEPGFTEKPTMPVSQPQTPTTVSPTLTASR